MSLTRLRNLSVKLLMAVGGLLMGALLAELGLRLLGFPVSGRYFQMQDKELGWVGRPGVEGLNREGNNYARLNSEGMHDREHTKAKPANTLRIEVYGDSYTQALQVPIEKTFSSVMEREFAHCSSLAGRKVEVLNLGVLGYGTAQELLMLRSRGWDYSPDIVVLAFFPGNDVGDNSAALSPKRMPPRPYFIHRNRKLVLDDSFLANPRFRFEESLWGGLTVKAVISSRLLQAVNAALYRGQVVQAELGLDPEIYGKSGNPAWLEAWNVTKDLIVEMNNEVVAHGAKFLPVILTTGMQAYPDSGVREQFMERSKAQDLFYIGSQFQALGKQSGFPVLDLAPAMQKYADQHGAFLHGFAVNHDLGYGHWNAEGHRLAGELIAQKICADILAH